MKKGPSYTVATIVYLTVLLATVLDTRFQFRLWPTVLLFLAMGSSAALAVLVQERMKSLTWVWMCGYVIVQMLIYVWLHCLPVPLWMFWLLAMPVISHASFALSWAGASLTALGYMALFLLFDCGGVTDANAVRVTLQFGVACFFTVIFSRITHQAMLAREEASRLAEELEQANARLRESAERDQQHAAMTERNRIARDIHDGLGHYLTTIAVQLEVARSLIRDNPDKAAEAVGKAERQSREALDEVRRSVRTLRTDVPPPNLRDAVAGLINESGLDAQFEVSGSVRALPAAATQALFRVAQEGLTNVRKHARTRSVRVELHFLEKATRIEIVDQGQGASGNNAGFGLSGLRERLAALGGSLQAANRPEGGYALRAELPL